MTDHQSSRGRLDDLITALYSTLRDVASRTLARSGGRKSLSPTELVHDCYLKLARAKAMKGLRPTEFVALASRAIRNVLVDRARQQGAVKRGGRLNRVTLSGASLTMDEEVDLLRLDAALQKLSLIDERQSRVVELRFFGGLSHDDIARILRCSARTINSEWAMAKAWLHRELERG